MYISMKAKISLIAGSLLLASSLSAADKLSYTPADPDKYPYPMYKDEVRDGKKVKTLYDGAIIKDQNFDVNNVYKSPISGKGWNRGEKADKATLKAWDTDVRPDGKGLPEGQMTVAKGAETYMKNCGHCHGDFGEGVDKFPVLSGGLGTLTLHPNSGAEPGPLKTLGSYAPYIAPFFWYIQTAMPLSAPKSLTNDEVYGILGYLLQVNEVQVNGEDIEDETVIDAAFIKSVVMPNEKGFAYNDLRSDETKNTRCMKDCTKDSEIVHIKTDGTEVEPEFGEERWFYGEVKKAEAGAGSPGKATYEASCSGCHGDGILGAHKFGDAKAWGKVMEKGFDAVLHNAINGVGGMPPKGGAMDLTDEQVKEAIQYMIDHSK